ncbi:unnamed protein product [uncultured bacterium]|nr:unnamed protein product [uncultured bacterium]
MTRWLMRSPWRPRNGWVTILLCVASLGAVLACELPGPSPNRPAQAQKEREGPGGRDQPLAMSPRQELDVGRRAYKQVMDEFGNRVLSPSNSQVLRVRHIADRIAKAAEIKPLQREINLRLRGYRFEWEANVLQDERVNAFCLPAGKIFVFTGLFSMTKGDDELATVMAHEVAHALAHHASERLARDQSGAGVLRSLKYNRDQES